MGFVTGFTGGVTLTLGVAYLTVLAHQRNRERQADILRANAVILNSMSAQPGAKPVALAPSRAEIEAVRRANFVEAAKDKWNSEIEGAVRWAQTKDWDRVREEAEGAAGRVWGRLVGGEVGQEVQKGVQQVEDAALRTKIEAEEKARSAAAAIELERRAEAERLRLAARDRAALEEPRLKTKAATTTATLQDKAADAKATAADAIQRGVEKGKELVGKAQAAVGLVEEKVVDAAAAAKGKMTPESDVERALRQRFERRPVLTEEQAYAERYTPLPRTDYRNLRGV